MAASLQDLALRCLSDAYATTMILEPDPKGGWKVILDLPGMPACSVNGTTQLFAVKSAMRHCHMIETRRLKEIDGFLPRYITRRAEIRACERRIALFKDWIDRLI